VGKTPTRGRCPLDLHVQPNFQEIGITMFTKLSFSFPKLGSGVLDQFILPLAIAVFPLPMKNYRGRTIINN